MGAAGPLAEPAAAPPSPLVRYGEFVFRHRNALFPAFLAVVVAFAPPATGPADPVLDALGIGLALLGEALRVAVVGLAYIKRGGLDKRVYAESLVTAGLFAHCRNPLYAGNFLIIGGLLVVHGNPWAVAAGLAFFAVTYAAVVAAEERYLAARFPADFARYRDAVPRWVPRLRGLRATLRSMRFNWRRVLAKEYASAVSWILVASALVAWSRLRAGAPPGTLVGPAAVGVLAGGAAVAVRGLKRAGRLRDV